MPPKTVANPYAKKRKAVGTTGVPSTSTITTPSPSSRGGAATAKRSDPKPNTHNDSGSGTFVTGTGTGIGIGMGVGTSFHAGSSSGFGSGSIAAGNNDALLPSDYAVVPGSFSQAFTSIDETDDFRRVSESFETEIRGNKNRESFRLAKVRKGRRSKKTSIFEQAKQKITNDDKDPILSPSASNRDGGRTGKRQPPAADADGEGDNRDGTEAPGGGNQSAAASAATTTTAAAGDVRIHHTMLQPHVLYVSTRQKGNRILELIRNVPIAYSPMVPDYIFGATSCALFLSIRYHKLYPRYIHRRIAELRGDFRLRVLLVLVDVDDNANTLLQLNTIGVTHQLTVVLSWSELEAARYLETYKARDGKDAAPIQKKESANPVDRVADFLTGERRGGGVNKTDAVNLWSQFSTVRGIAAATPDELALVGGMGPVKVRRLHEALHKPFSKLRTRARKQQQQQQQQQPPAANDSEQPAEEHRSTTMQPADD